MIFRWNVLSLAERPEAYCESLAVEDLTRQSLFRMLNM